MDKTSRQNDPTNSRSANSPQDCDYEDLEKPPISISDETPSLPNIFYDSNNFDTLTKQYMQVISIVNNYYKSLKSRERIDRQILDIEMECYFNEINDNRDAALGTELILLYGNHRDILMENHEIAQHIDKQIGQNLLTNSRNSKEKVQLALLVDLIDSLQERLKTIDIERNNLHAKLREIKKKSSEHANGQNNDPQEDPRTPNESANIGRKRNASTDLVKVPIKKINVHQQKNGDHVELDFNRPSMLHKSESTDSGTANLRCNRSQIAVISTSQANSLQASASQANLLQPSTSQANLSQPSTSQANLSQHSTSQANSSRPSTFQTSLSQPSTSPKNFWQALTSQANLLQPSASQVNLPQSSTPRANSSQPSISQANLSRSSTSQANLSRPSISQANLSQTSKSETNLLRPSTPHANLLQPSESQANLSQPSKSQANLSQTSKLQANLLQTSKSQANLSRAPTSQSNLSQTSKSQGNLLQPSASQVNMPQFPTSRTNSSQPSISQANLSRLSTSQANLSQSPTSRANSSQPSISQANLSQSPTSRANSSQPSISQANLSRSSTSQANLSQPSTSQANLSQPSKPQANLSQSSTSQVDLLQALTSQANKQTSKIDLSGSSTSQIKVLNFPIVQKRPSKAYKLSSDSGWHTPTDFTLNVENAADESQTNNSSRPVWNLPENPIGIESRPVSIDHPRFVCMSSGTVLDNCKMYKNLKNHTVPPANAERPANIQPKHIRGLTGLSNPGGYSHINSIIQCVSKSFPSLPMNLANAVQHTQTKEPIILEFSHVILSLLSDEHLTVSANALKIAFEESVCGRNATSRTDPIDFLKFLLQSLHRALQSGSKKRKLRSNSNSLDTNEEWLKSIDGSRSIISDLFYGQKRLTTMCEICKNCTVVYEPFTSLTIPLPRSGLNALLTKRPRYDLTTMLADYFEEDRIAGFECNKCGVSCNATTKIDLTRLAPILILHFERCKDDGPMNCSLLKYPLNDLNLKPFLHIQPNLNSNYQKTHHYKYSLYAVCARNDVTGNDCFFTECQNFEQFTWHSFVDELVTEVTPKQVTKHMSTCCLLFYRSFPDDPNPSPTAKK